jgi:ribose-phosphate pyrophosphokinase
MYGKLSVVSGSANQPLAEGICRHLGIPQTMTETKIFPNENIFFRILESVREQDVFLVQPLASPVNNNVMELLIAIDALKRASAARITAVVPYYAYGRTDKKDQPRVPITARLLADCIQIAGAQRFLTMDLHAAQIQGFFSIPVDDTTANYIVNDYFIDKIESGELDDLVVVAPDLGSAKLGRNFAERLHVPLVVVEKRRLANTTNEVMSIIGHVKHRQAVIVDDEIDTAGTLCQTADLLVKEGVQEIYACATHGVFSGKAIERLTKSPIKQLVVTNTLPLPPEKRLSKIKVLDVAPLLAQVIQCIHTGGSLGEVMTKAAERGTTPPRGSAGGTS